MFIQHVGKHMFIQHVAKHMSYNMLGSTYHTTCWEAHVHTTCWEAHVHRIHQNLNSNNSPIHAKYTRADIRIEENKHYDNIAQG